MKGHLDVEQLKSMKREDLQALAKDLGVSAGGKTEEIIARIAAVEVEVPEESQLTEEEKAAAEAAKQEEAAKEAAAGEQDEATQAAKAEEEKAAAEQKATEEKQAAGLVKVKVTTRFLDKQLNQIKDTGETYSVSRERAAELTAAGVAEIVG